MKSALAKFDLTGRRALVTGSSRGIGAAIARGLAEAGAEVCVHCAGNRAAAQAVAEQIRALGQEASVLQADLADPEAPAALIAEAGELDILVANASVQYPEPWADVSVEHYEQQLAVNVRSTFELIRLVAPGMTARGWGRILTIGSVQETLPHPEMTVYAATKCAQRSLDHSFGLNLACHGVTVNNLAPGVILTDRNTGRLADADYAKLVKSKIPAGRFGEATDCVGAALLLCSDAGAYITGQSLYVDGGMSL